VNAKGVENYSKLPFIIPKDEFHPKGRQLFNIARTILNDVHMKKRKLATTKMDKSIAELANKTDQVILAIWAADCAERVISYFEEKCPEDDRPRKAIEATRMWAQTGVFKMADVRKVALAAHAAARNIEKDDAARSAARAAGQALATAHVPNHAIAAAIYAATAVRDTSNSSHADAATIKERIWQYQHLLELITNS
jgi:hypothetical protein